MDWGYLLATAVGGLIGVSGSVGVARMHRTTERENQRAELLRRVAAELLNATRDLWQAEQALRLAIFELVTGDRGPSAREERQALEESRQAAFAKRREATRAADTAVTELWLVSPALREVGQDLVAACWLKPSKSDALPIPAETERYNDAREALVKAVTDLLP